MAILHPFRFLPTRPHHHLWKYPFFLRRGETLSSKNPFKKHSKTHSTKIRLVYILHLCAADYDHLRLTSRSFAIFPACCERRRPCDLNPFCILFHTIPAVSQGGTGNSILGPVFIVLFRLGPPMMFRTCSDLLLDVHVALGTRSWFFLPLYRVGKKDGSLASDLLPRLDLSLSLSLYRSHGL